MGWGLSIGIRYAASYISAPGDGAVQCVHRDRGFHQPVDRITEGAVGEHFLDRTNVKLASKRAMPGDFGQPHFPGSRCGVVPLDEIVMHRWTTRAPLTSLGFFAER